MARPPALAAAAAFALVSSASAPPAAQRPPQEDPASFFHPQITLTRDERTTLDRGRAVARTVREEPGEVAVFSAIRVGASPDVFLEWIRRIEALKASEYVKAIRRFSNPPRLADLAALALDEEDLESLRRCRPGDCGLKLSAGEITTLRRRAELAGSKWRTALQEGFRQALLERAQGYLRAGLLGAPPYNDQSEPVSLDREGAALLSHSPYLASRAPRVAAYLSGFPEADDPSLEDFLYWSMTGSLAAWPAGSCSGGCAAKRRR